MNAVAKIQEVRDGRKPQLGKAEALELIDFRALEVLASQEDVDQEEESTNYFELKSALCDILDIIKASK